jgi:hypothetical protein
LEETIRSFVDERAGREENTRLKRLVADLTLDKVMLQDALTATEKREWARHLVR